MILKNLTTNGFNKNDDQFLNALLLYKYYNNSTSQKSHYREILGVKRRIRTFRFVSIMLLTLAINPFSIVTGNCMRIVTSSSAIVSSSFIFVFFGPECNHGTSFFACLLLLLHPRPT